MGSIVPHYRQHVREEDCRGCHDDGPRSIDGLEETVRGILLNLDRYRESVSIIITTNDRQTRLLHNGIANARGEEMLATIQRVNASAGLMVQQLREQNQRLLRHSERSIEASVGAVGAGLRPDPRLPALVDEPALRLAAARHRVGDPRRPLLPPARSPRAATRSACSPTRFNLMAEHLQARDPQIREKTRRDRGREPPPPRPQRDPRGEGRGAHARPAGVARAGPAHQRRARGLQAPPRGRQPGPGARQPGQGQLPVDHLPRAQDAALGHQRLPLADPRRALRERRRSTCARRCRSPSAAASSSRA